MLKCLIIIKFVWNTVSFTSVTLWYLAHTTNLDGIIVQHGIYTNFNIHSGPVQSTNFTVLFRAQSINEIKNKKESCKSSDLDMELIQDMLVFLKLNTNR